MGRENKYEEKKKKKEEERRERGERGDIPEARSQAASIQTDTKAVKVRHTDRKSER